MKRIKVVGIAVLASVTVGAAGALAQGMTFFHTITGEDLKIPESTKPEGRDTEGVKLFLQTGNNPYNEVGSCLHEGEQTYLASCSGCHGHFGEGKVGPGLNDAYWTYPKNKTDKGLLETIYGGAQGMMGPHNDLSLDEALKLMAWIRHLYTGDVAEADWLTDQQKANFKPFVEVKGGQGGETKIAANANACKPSGG
jgi:cytochrome c-L